MPTIGLVMTTYNEEKVIKRCLESVLPYIDYYSIGVDEKTTDNTKQIIEETLKDKTGVVFNSPWNGFADARNQAFENFKWDVDWFLIIDADMVLVEEGFDKELLDPSIDEYFLHVKQGGVVWDMNWIVNAKYEWVWKGVLHEFLTWVDDKTPIRKRLDGLYLKHGGDGGARPKDTAMFKRDVNVFLDAMIDETDSDMLRRYTFYLAQSYRDAGMKKESILFYRLRTMMGGWEQEIYLSHYYAGNQSKNYYDFLNAYKTIPTRCDALVEMLHWGVNQNNISLALKSLEYYDEAVKNGIIWDSEGLFFTDKRNHLEDWVAVTMGFVGRCDEAIEKSEEIVKRYQKEDDENNINRLKGNIESYKIKKGLI